MTNISKYARRSLSEYAAAVPIDILMIDPDYLDSNPFLAQQLQEFLDIPHFAAAVRTSFDTLKTFAEAWNNDPTHRHRVSLKVYRTIPTMSMVMVDPDTPSGELVVEFFLYQSGEYRPRFHIRTLQTPDGLFHRFKSEYLRLDKAAHEIV